MGAGRQMGDGGSNETSVACDGVGEEWARSGGCEALKGDRTRVESQ
jgi:hypothetical protein